MSTSNAIVAENQKPGTPESVWGLANGPSSSIEGFTTNISINVGEQVDFKIDTVANDYKIEIYRLGYYGGDGARLVATLDHSAGPATEQPDPIVDLSTGLVDAGNWAITDSWQTPADAVSGVYIAKLVREDGVQGENFVPFILRDDTSTSDIVYQTSDSSWQAYNTWGGANLYQSSLDNTHLGSPTSPDRAYAVSYNRPLVNTGLLNGSIFGQEYAAIRWLEKNGYDVTYQTSVDTAARGDLLVNHDVFMNAGHDEYWSAEQRNNVEAARDAGVNLAFLSGNDVYWKTRWECSIDGSGAAYRTLVCYKESWDGEKIDPSSEWTGQWRDVNSPEGARPENSLTGTLFMVNGNLSSMTVPYEYSKFQIWDNTKVANLQPGQTASFYGLLGYEWNVDADNGSRPAGLINLSSTTVQVSKLLVGDTDLETGPGVATHSLTLYRADSGALVFGAGSIFFPWALDSHHQGIDRTDPAIQQMMVNLFAQMDVQPGSLQPNLVPGAPLTDFTAPVESLIALSGMAILGSPVVISGTSADLGGGVVAGTEVSTDGGLTWHEAQGFEKWSYTWIPTKLGDTIILARSVDDSLNVGTPKSLGVTVTDEVAVAESTRYVTTTLSDPISATVLADPINATIDLVSTDSAACCSCGLCSAAATGEGGGNLQNLVELAATLPSASIVGGADAALFSVDAATGELSFLNDPDFERPADANRDNLYEVTVQITHGSYTRLLPYVVKVTNVTPESLLGDAGDNVFIASSDKEFFAGQNGSDTVSYALAKLAITANIAAPSLNKGDAANDTYSSIENLVGTPFNDTLKGNAAPNVLEGGSGNDLLDGGSGIDTVSYAHAASASNGLGVTVNLSSSQSQNTVTAGADTLFNFENLTGSNFKDTLTGNAATNIITGLGGNDTLDGGAGADTMIGGAGDDVYIVDNKNDFVDELTGGSGIDTVRSSISFRLGDATRTMGSVENLSLLGSASIFATGNALDNTLIGNAGANILTGLAGDDTLDGGSGADTLFGGTGNDTYLVDNTGDVVDEANGGGGIDTIRTALSLNLSDVSRVKGSVENLTLTGTGSVSGWGNSFNNILVGNSAANTLTGLGGNDTLDGAGGADTMIGGAGDDIYVIDNSGDIADEAAGGQGIDTILTSLNFKLSDVSHAKGNIENLTLIGASAISAWGTALDNTLIGNSASNTLTGLGGNDTLDGGAGADTMIGGAGDDVYIVDNKNDVVDELTGGSGIDTVRSSISFRLGDATRTMGSVENLSLLGSASIFATGNALNNTLIGNAGANILTGLAGDDTLDGGSGADTLFGGTGNDTYLVDNTGDVVDEANGGGGIDTIMSTVSFSLRDSLHALGNIENLILQGGNSIAATGNDLDNVIIGNLASNELVGLAGRDHLDGGGGVDTVSYEQSAAAVTVNLVTGNASGGDADGDTLVNIENLRGSNFDDTLVGNSENNIIVGLEGDDAISGEGGNDTLFGHMGVDVLAGGFGADKFGYLTAKEGGDFIEDFSVTEDVLLISASGFGGGLVAGKSLVEGTNFFADTGAAPLSEVGTFLYDPATQDLAWDVDGSGAIDPVQIAHFDTALTLNPDHFEIMA